MAVWAACASERCASTRDAPALIRGEQPALSCLAERESASRGLLLRLLRPLKRQPGPQPSPAWVAGSAAVPSTMPLVLLLTAPVVAACCSPLASAAAQAALMTTEATTVTMATTTAMTIAAAAAAAAVYSRGGPSLGAEKREC